MAKITWQDIGALVDNDVGSIQKAIIVPAKEALRQTKFALGGNLTIADNSYAAIVTLGQLGSNTTQTLVHGTEYIFQNPLKTTPVGFTPIKAFDSNRVAIPIPPCTFNTSRTDGYLGLTANFAPPVANYVSARVALGAPIGLLNNSSKNVASINLAPAEWDVSGVVQFTGTATGLTRIIGSVSPTTNTLANEGDDRIDFPVTSLTASDAGVSIPAVKVATATTIPYYLVALGSFTGATLNVCGRISARAIGPAPGYSANITGILWGG